ncbi:MAG: LarC family nickel insertion protein [Candidatus Omnitrophica bacterium]|nr:LarC family nickel insertion protein [Candidatus Omnitrophota bacterium]
MKTIYFHLIGGASGDMLLASLIDLGCPFFYLKNEFKKLNIKSDFKVENKKNDHYVTKKIKFIGPNINYSYKDIIKIIKKSKLKAAIKTKALSAYSKLFDIEKKIHHLKTGDFKFHHLGQIDAILEIVGFFVALDYLKIQKICVSTFPIDLVKPATLKLLEGRKIKLVQAGYETVTPTAAVLLVDAEQNESVFSFKKSSFAFGDFGVQDYLVAYLTEENSYSIEKDTIVKIETNIDDMSPQIFENLFDILFKNGAKEVYIEQVIVKKSRPAFVLNVLCNLKDFFKLRDLIFLNTSTFGIRYQIYNRDKLRDDFIYKKTKFGKIKFRVSRGQFKKILPEYRDCLEISKKLNIPLINIYQNIK